jgi:hypothetical protein
MKLKNIVTAAVIAVSAAAFIIGSAATGEAKAMKKKKAPPAPHYSAQCWFTAEKPVCATRGGMSFTYRNACFAGNDGAIVKSQKACKPAKAKKSGKAKAKKAMKKPAMKKPAMKKKK